MRMSEQAAPAHVVAELAREIRRDFPGDLHLIAVLKGAFGIFYNMPLLYNQFLNLGTGQGVSGNPTLVSNVETLYNVHMAEMGTPVTEKFLSVCGAVKEPQSLWAPVGTPFRDLLALAGGATVDAGEAQ